MNTKTLKKLNGINQKFYQITAKDFDETRQYFWQGWKNIIKYINNFNQLKLLDLGCGNTRFYQFIKQNYQNDNFKYFGLDNNQQLLDLAKKNTKKDKIYLKKVDIVTSLIDNEEIIKEKNFDLVVSFGVFHHIPSFSLRLKMLEYLVSKINQNGLIIISLWQFMEYERFRKKILTSQQLLINLNLKKADLEKNDAILDWNRGKKAFRYCHHINTVEQLKLITESKLTLIDSFRSDGKQKNINTYLILKKVG